MKSSLQKSYNLRLWNGRLYLIIVVLFIIPCFVTPPPFPSSIVKYIETLVYIQLFVSYKVFRLKQVMWYTNVLGHFRFSPSCLNVGEHVKDNIEMHCN